MAKRLLSSSIFNLLQLAKYIWALPATSLGLFLTLLALASGGSAQRIHGIIEVHGGIVTRLLRNGTPWLKSISALTLGHVVLGVNQQLLDETRSHERIHVGQYEKWGPLFIPLYLLYGLIAILKKQNPYLENRFEKEAFRKE